MYETIKWDGTSPIMHEALIKEAFIGEKGFFSEDEIRLAKQTSYGDLAELLKKNHKAEGNHGRCGDYPVSGSPAAVTVHLPELEIQYEMTWNKAAKAIHRWVHEKTDSNVPAVSENTVLSDDYAEAVRININIKNNAQAAQMSLYEVCKGLREMNITKLYKELGYNSFESYCEQEVGIGRRMAYKYVAVANIENVKSISHFGVTKLSLLADLTEYQRAEIIENTDVENTTVKKLKEEIEQLKSEQSTLSANYDRMNSDYLEIGDKLADAELKLQKSEEYREELCDENDKMSLRISELLAEVDDLKDRPIDVTYSDADNREVENMRKAMDKMDLDWSAKYNEEQERNIKQIQELNIKHTAELNQMKAEYEDKIRNAASEGSIGKEKVKQKSDIYFDMLNSIMDDIEDFLFEINDSSLQTKHIKRFISCVQDFIDRVDDDEGE